MAFDDIGLIRWLRLPLAVSGLFVLFGSVAVIVIAFSVVFHVALELFVGTPLSTAVADLSVADVAADRVTDPLTLVAAGLFCILLLPSLTRYYRWVGLTSGESDADSQRRA